MTERCWLVRGAEAHRAFNTYEEAAAFAGEWGKIIPMVDEEKAAQCIGKGRENERLRFEGELDKWMKIIGAGITGYQPEAYAAMDHACRELVKARLEIAKQLDALKEIIRTDDTGEMEYEARPDGPVQCIGRGKGRFAAIASAAIAKATGTP